LQALQTDGAVFIKKQALCMPSFGKMRLKPLSVKGEFWPLWQLPDPFLIRKYDL
jgi:hypothetical protein